MLESKWSIWLLHMFCFCILYSFSLFKSNFCLWISSNFYLSISLALLFAFSFHLPCADAFVLVCSTSQDFEEVEEIRNFWVFVIWAIEYCLLSYDISLGMVSGVRKYRKILLLFLFCLCSCSCKFSIIIVTLNCFLSPLGSMLLQHRGGWVTSQLLRGNCSYEYHRISDFFSLGYSLSANIVITLTLYWIADSLK